MDEADFVLTNHVRRSVAKEVRVDGASENGYSEITILDEGHFEDLSGSASGEFKARFRDRARWAGASFEVTWYDEQDARRYETIFFPGWERRPEEPNRWVGYSNEKETPF